MKRTALTLLAMLSAAPLAAATGDTESLTPSEVVALALEELFPNAINLQVSPPEQRGDIVRFCATTDAFNSSGYFIGLTYWEVMAPAKAPETASRRNVTGLLSDCYGGPYRDQ